jgi:hypothetical protein
VLAPLAELFTDLLHSPVAQTHGAMLGEIDAGT